MNTFKRLFITVLIMLCLPSFAVWGQVLDLGDGLIIPMANVLVVANASGTVAVGSGTIDPIFMTEIYDKSGEFSGATFTASIDQTIVIDYRQSSANTQQANIYLNLIPSGGAHRYAQLSSIHNSGFNFNSRVAYDGRFTIDLSAGDAVSLSDYCFMSNPANREYQKLFIYRIR